MSNVMVISDPEAVAEQVARLVSSCMPAQIAVEKPMSVKETSEWLGISQSVIRNLAKQNKIPCCKIGDRCIFYKHQLAEWQGAETNSASKITEEDAVLKMPSRLRASK